MSIRLRVSNFRALRNVDLVDEGSLSILVGPNESGKSTLKGAIQFAFTGSAYGRKGRDDVRGLISHGCDRLAVFADVNGISASRTTSTGDPLKQVAERLGVPEAVLPLLFDSEMAGDCGTKAMQAFLAGAASSKFDPAAHFAADQDVRYYIDLAFRAGKFTTKHIIEYCETNRAAQKEPAKPVRPDAPRPDPSVLAAAETTVRDRTAAVAALEAVHTDLNNRGAALDNIANYLRQQAAYEIGLAASRTADPLASVRDKLVAITKLNAESVQAATDTLSAISNFADAVSAGTVFVTRLREAKAAAESALALNPPPVAPPALPVLAQTAVASFDALRNQHGTIAEPLVAAESAALSGTRQANTAQHHVAREDLAAAKLRLTQLTEVVGAWKAFDAAEPTYVEACLRATEQWNRWDNAAKKIKAAEEEFLRTQGAGFSDLVNTIGGSLLQGRRITVDPGGITLGIEPLSDLSKSTKWRVEAAVCAAIAVTMKSPLLILDGADILDDANRLDFIQTLVSHIAPMFKHTIVTVTRSNLDAEKPLQTPGATKWLVRNGTITKCVAPTA